MPSTTSNDLNTSAKWDESNETHDGYKAWVNDVSLWANNNQMLWIMKIAKRLQQAPNFRRPVSRAQPLREQFLDEAQDAGKTGVTADRDKIEFRLFNSSSIFNITLREELFSLPKKNQPCCLILVSWR